VNRRTADLIVGTPISEVLPQLAPDGNWLLYEAGTVGLTPPDYKLMRVPIQGGTPEQVPVNGPLDEFRCGLLPGSRCVLRTTIPDEYYVFHDLDAVRGEGRELARTKWLPAITGDWTISPDGRYVAIPNHDPRDARIRVVALEPKPKEVQERELVLDALTDIRGLVWAADGSAWFVSVDTNIGNRLLYVYQDGRSRSLGDILGWAVPSPDGRHVAFLDRIIATNAWLIDRR
jgi:eukaryotic-like serine/threonine-protein kinase